MPLPRPSVAIAFASQRAGVVAARWRLAPPGVNGGSRGPGEWCALPDVRVALELRIITDVASNVPDRATSAHRADHQLRIPASAAAVKFRVISVSDLPHALDHASTGATPMLLRRALLVGGGGVGAPSQLVPVSGSLRVAPSEGQGEVCGLVDRCERRAAFGRRSLPSRSERWPGSRARGGSYRAAVAQRLLPRLRRARGQDPYRPDPSWVHGREAARRSLVCGALADGDGSRP